MRNTMMIVLLIISALLIGCAPQGTDIVMNCIPPLIHEGDGCCLDADENGVCDVDERPAEEQEEPEEETVAEQPEEAEEEQATESEDEEKEPEPEAKMNTQEEAEKVGKLFAISWEKKQYNVMYTMFTPDLKGKKTVTEFTTIMELDPFYKKIREVNFKGASRIDDSTAELKMTMHTNVQDLEVPAASLEFAEGGWKVQVFSDVFDIDTYDAACSGYRYDNSYTMADCAFDYAKKMKDPEYCDISECHYVECLKALGKPSGMVQEAEQCYKCQPTGKTTNECILDVAIKHDKVSACDIMDDEKYNDKYCICYGGFAKHKGTVGYCNMIQIPTYKEVCVKGYEGGFC
jgi:hypothetical protein